MRATLSIIGLLGLASSAHAQPLTWGLAGGSEKWPADQRATITRSMDEAVALYNQYGTFQKHVTASYNPGVPTAQSNYDGWLEYGGQNNTRVALHEIAHALGMGTYGQLTGGAWKPGGAGDKLIKLYEGQAAVINTGGTHFWPYGLNYDTEDNPAARERHCKIVAAMRFDMGIVGDSDKDGMPDDWETLYFKDLSKGARDDADGDGISNLDEYRSDSDPNLASPVRDGHSYRIRIQTTERTLTLAGPAREATQLQLNQDEKEGQVWTAHYVGEGFWRFAIDDGALVMEVPGSDTASARPIQLATWSNALQQQWRIVGGIGAKPGFWQLANRETARLVDGLNSAEGTPVQQYPYLGNIFQQYWRFDEVNTPGGADASVRDAGAPDADVAVEQEPSDGGIKPWRRDASISDAMASRRDAAITTGDEDSERGDDDEQGAAAPRASASDGCSAGRRGAGGTWALLLTLCLALRARTGRRRDLRA